MQKQVKEPNRYAKVVAIERTFPYFVFSSENISMSMNYRQELEEIMKNYIAYKDGAQFYPEGSNGNYFPSNIHYKTSKNLIDKEARFMFSHMPDINITGIADGRDEEIIESYKRVINKVLENNNFGQKLLKATKDCFIGKRVACLVDMSDRAGIIIHFYTSLEFYYERDFKTNEITMFISFENVTESKSNSGRRFLINKYELENDAVYVHSYLCDGTGKSIIEYVPRHKTDFRQIPVVVIINGGLLSDKTGVSDLEDSIDYEGGYNHIANADIDSCRKGMNPIKYTVDINHETTKNLPVGPGAYWDLESNSIVENPKPQVGQISPALNHTEAVKSSLDRLRSAMYESMDIPDISKDGLLSGITSFKALKALYYPLMNRCDEKLVVWKPAVRDIMRFVIEIAVLNESVTKQLYQVNEIKNVEYNIEVVENYAIIDDEEEEKRVDMEEIAVKGRSRFSYLKKWRSGELKTDDDIEEELLRIAEEENMMDTMSMNTQVQSRLNEKAMETQTEQSIEEMEVEQEAKNMQV